MTHYNLYYIFSLLLITCLNISCNKEKETPIAQFSLIQSNCSELPCRVDFFNESSNAISYIWDFGDGNKSYENSPVHDYESNGNYNVTLEAINLVGSDFITQNITISSLINQTQGDSTPLSEGNIPVFENDIYIMDIPSFHGIISKISEDIELEYGTEKRVIINRNGSNSAANFLNTEIENDVWDIKYNNPTFGSDIEIKIITPAFNYVKNSGNGCIRTNDEPLLTINNQLTIEINGSGSMDLNIETHSLNSKINGSGDISIKGIALENTLKINGSGSFDGFKLSTLDMDIDMNGSGDANIKVTENLYGSINGSGNIYYKGYPEIDVEITGSGELLDAN